MTLEAIEILTPSAQQASHDLHSFRNFVESIRQ